MKSLAMNKKNCKIHHNSTIEEMLEVDYVQAWTSLREPITTDNLVLEKYIYI